MATLYCDQTESRLEMLNGNIVLWFYFCFGFSHEWEDILVRLGFYNKRIRIRQVKLLMLEKIKIFFMFFFFFTKIYQVNWCRANW